MEKSRHIRRLALSFMIFLIIPAGPGETRVVFQPDTKREFLFKIQRTRDADEVYFDILLDDRGDLKLPEPIVTYWVRHTSQGEIEPLRWAERRFAYGIKYLEKRPDFVSFYFVSNRNMAFHVRKDPEKQFRLYAILDDMETRVTDIIIFFQMRFYGFPNIEKVEIYGINPETGAKVITILYP
ncbi:MAG: DUF4833 domain-containing protein [Bacteroidia bacterium]|nr:MAG: DUF4833 domain-containing protein [Bacteroidia bacterium]